MMLKTAHSLWVCVFFSNFAPRNKESIFYVVKNDPVSGIVVFNKLNYD